MKTLKGIVAAVIMLGVVFGGSRLAEATLSDFSNGGSGTLYTGSGSSLGQVIPDNTLAGIGYSINFADTGLAIGDINVTLNLSGGYNGDIYAYLMHGSQLLVLLNQITGTAASGSGFNNVTLTEGAGQTIQLASGTAGQSFTGSFTAFDNLSAFNGADPNGAWTIFFADRGAGDTSTLTGFSLGITAVPEPVNVAMGIFGVLLGGLALVRWLASKRRSAATRQL